ncbi:MAG: outer membrane lipoprotein-sorting protein [Deltaproteobacteria bacterium]|nr:outer membrane lipoprotein-sorting protein [Deltaproteobacteria bacterium]
MLLSNLLSRFRLGSMTGLLRRYVTTLIAVICGAVLIAASEIALADGKPTKADIAELGKVLDGVDNLWFSAKSSADMTMSVKTSHYDRTLKLTYWTSGADKAVVKINYPPSEKGTVTLRLGSDMYNYLPNVDKTVKVSAALRSASWMGSHFSNEDLVHSAYLARDYDGTIVETKKKGSANIWTVDLVPKKGTAVVWSKIRMIVEKERRIPQSQIFYDERGTKVRTLSFSDLKKIGGKMVPSKILVTPADLPGEHTEMVYEAIRHGVKFDSGFFSLERLKSL